MRRRSGRPLKADTDNFFCKKCVKFTSHRIYSIRSRSKRGGQIINKKCVVCEKMRQVAEKECRSNELLRSDYSIKYRDKGYSSLKHREQKLRIDVFNMYGNVCACCGETNLFFLEIDHVNNDGSVDRKKNGKSRVGFLTRVLKNLQLFQLLCSNCNQGKARNNGVCPHKTPNSIPRWFVEDLFYG